MSDVMIGLVQLRQSISDQSSEFNAWFYSTVQWVIPGNDSQGLRYGTVGTPEKLFLTWKEDEADDVELKLDKYLSLLRCLGSIPDLSRLRDDIARLPKQFPISLRNRSLLPATRWPAS